MSDLRQPIPFTGDLAKALIDAKSTLEVLILGVSYSEYVAGYALFAPSTMPLSRSQVTLDQTHTGVFLASEKGDNDFKNAAIPVIRANPFGKGTPLVVGNGPHVEALYQRTGSSDDALEILRSIEGFRHVTNYAGIAAGVLTPNGNLGTARFATYAPDNEANIVLLNTYGYNLRNGTLAMTLNASSYELRERLRNGIITFKTTQEFGKEDRLIEDVVNALGFEKGSDIIGVSAIMRMDPKLQKIIIERKGHNYKT